MSDSSSEEDDRFKQAVDPSLFSNSMFEDTPKDKKKQPEKVLAKSNRIVDEPVVSKEDIDVTPSMQKYVAKKLASLIDNQVTFVEPKDDSVVVPDNDEEEDFGIRLFSNSVAPVTKLVTEEVPDDQPPKKKKKKLKKKDESEPDETTKISESVVDPSFILDQVEVRSWHHNEKRLSKKVDHYNSRNGNLFPVEPQNEFSKLRKKNNWDYKKIREPLKRPAVN